MSKVTFEFDLHDNDDLTDFKLHAMAREHFGALVEMRSMFRDIRKYNPEDLPNDQLDAIERLENRFLEWLSDENISLNI